MMIQGPAGALEAELLQAPTEKTITAVLCHPHPQYGGSMHDAVLATAAETLMQRGVNCLRFNFRGVGASEGTYDGGDGETQDLLAVCTWVAEEYPRDKLWLCGYSFGAYIAWQARLQSHPQRLLLIAPPNAAMAFESPEPDSEEIRVHAFAGDNDDFVDITRFESQWGEAGVVIPGADHFFSGYHEQLAEQMMQALKQD